MPTSLSRRGTASRARGSLFFLQPAVYLERAQRVERPTACSLKFTLSPDLSGSNGLDFPRPVRLYSPSDTRAFHNAVTTAITNRRDSHGHDMLTPIAAYLLGRSIG
jgi:hypothetical protein